MMYHLNDSTFLNIELLCVRCLKKMHQANICVYIFFVYGTSHKQKDCFTAKMPFSGVKLYNRSSNF